MTNPRAIFPDGLAELCKKSAGQSYRPSNGTEGEYFSAAFCAQCKAGTGFHDENAALCDIAMSSMAFGKDDPEYPKEWIYGEDGQPKCTAFDPS